MLDEMFPYRNTGVLGDGFTPEQDYIAGAETGIIYEARKENGDWREYRPTDETQRSINADTMGCTFYSAYNSIEEQVDFLVKSGKLAGEKLKWLQDNGYFDSNGKFNVSDRFGNVVGGTQKFGNYLKQPWEISRTEGLLPEQDFPAPKNFTWEEYYQEPGVERREKAKKVLNILDFKYEWVFWGEKQMTQELRDKMILAIKQAPLHICAPVCPGWGAGIMVSPCGKTQTEHATLIDCIDKIDQFFYDYDHYFPYGKTLSKYYVIPSVIKGIVTVKEDQKPLPLLEKFQHCFIKDIKLGDKSDEVKMLQKALKINGVFPVKQLETGFYGPTTQKAVRDFQAKYKVANFIELKLVDGKKVGPATRKKLNELYNK